MKYAYALVAALLLSLSGLSFSQTFRDRIVDNHYAYTPSDQGRFPTLIAMPGCSGISSDNLAAEESNPRLREGDHYFRRHYRHMADKLEAEMVRSTIAVYP